MIGVNNSGSSVNPSPVSLSLSKLSLRVDKNMWLSLASILAFYTSFLNLENGLV